MTAKEKFEAGQPLTAEERLRAFILHITRWMERMPKMVPMNTVCAKTMRGSTCAVLAPCLSLLGEDIPGWFGQAILDGEDACDCPRHASPTGKAVA
jgi:hypothetical protein